MLQIARMGDLYAECRVQNAMFRNAERRVQNAELRYKSQSDLWIKYFYYVFM